MIQKCTKCGHTRSPEDASRMAMDKMCPNCNGIMKGVEIDERIIQVELFNILSRDHRKEFELVDQSPCQDGFRFKSKEVRREFEEELEKLMNRYFSDGTMEEGFEVEAVGTQISNAEG
jgi:hypothetical protein